MTSVSSGVFFSFFFLFLGGVGFLNLSGVLHLLGDPKRDTVSWQAESAVYIIFDDLEATKALLSRFDYVDASHVLGEFATFSP